MLMLQQQRQPTSSTMRQTQWMTMKLRSERASAESSKGRVVLSTTNDHCD